MNNRILIFFSCFLLLVSAGAQAQKMRNSNGPKAAYKFKNGHGAISFIAGVGFCSYYGDMKDNRTDLWAKPSVQLGAQYRVNNRLHIRSEVLWYRISGADSLNGKDTGIHDRNLSFRADNFEWNAVALVHLFNKYSRNRPPLNPYAFGGVGFTTNNPKAYYEGEWHSLRPLMTEGVEYKSVALVVPAGIGLAFHLSENWDIQAEYGYRFTFTDYLDDVSTVYKGVENFDEGLARDLSDRRPEINLDPMKAGKRRGNSGVNDWYLVVGLKVVYTPTFVPKGQRGIDCEPNTRKRNNATRRTSRALSKFNY